MTTRAILAAAALALALAPSGCKRDERGFRVQPPSADRAKAISQSDLYPGLTAPPPFVVNEYEENAEAVSNGQTLYNQYNCSGCHANGGGGMGPALMDKKWVYGSDPANIFATIVEGRPNGMPSFRGKIPDYQVWQIVAYVRSLSGLVPRDVPSARADDMQNRTKGQPPPEPPKKSTTPASK